MKTIAKATARTKRIAWCLGAAVLGAAGIIACTKEVSSRPNYVFKKASSEGTVAKFMGKEIAAKELYKGIQNDIYEARMKVHQIKMGKLKRHILETLVKDRAASEGLSNDQFLSQVVAGDAKVTEKDVEELIKERGVPKNHVTDNFKKRVERFLMGRKKREAIDEWFAAQTAKHPVEVYLEKPVQPVFFIDPGASPFAGGADAKVTVVEFSDYQCGFCQRGAEVLRELKKIFGKRIKIVFKNFPLPIHNHARLAAEAGLCAQDEGNDAFWKMHDKMFADSKNLDRKGLSAKAEEVGLNAGAFRECLEKGKYKARVAGEMKQGEDAGVKSTPTFFVNGRMFPGVKPVEFFADLIKEELEKK